MRTFAAAALVALALLAGRASAQPFPARSGERGILDVPDAEVSGVRGGQLAAELRFDHRPGFRDEFGPLPLYAVAGVTERLDLGLTIRESGQPDDPRPARALFGAALKLRLFRGDGALPAAALGAVFDRINGNGVFGARLSLSAGLAPLRLAAFAGGEAEVQGLRNAGPTAGLAASLAIARGFSLAAEALTGPRGESYGGALRWHGKTMGVSLGANYLPREEGYRAALTFAFAPAPAHREVPSAPIAAPPPSEAPPQAPRFTDDRPKFRLRIPTTGALAHGAPGSTQYGPYVARSEAAPVSPKPQTGAKAAAPSLEDLAEAQLRDQEALAAARGKRVNAAGEQLDARDATAAEEASRLAARERELTAQEQQIALREQRAVVRTPSEPQRQLESIIAQIAAEERNLAAQEKSYLPALDAASGRERDTAAREQLEATEAARLEASIRSDTPRAAQLELRKQVLAARNRQLAAMETRLLARGERIDAFERQLRTRSDRLNAWGRRLDARLERLALIEKLLAPPRTPPPASPARPADDKGATAPPRDKAAFVMVVKAPTAIVQERSADAGTAAGGATPGVAAEKAVLAATVVMFPTPTTQLSELDRETLDNIAKLAAKSGGELLIWARAKDPSLVAEAERRAAEIRARATTAGPLEAGRITTRVTMRPGAAGVDVVVSALRESAKPKAETPEAGSAPRLQPGESGKRQIRDAVVSAQPSIEACVGEHLQRRGLQRSEGLLRVQVSANGRVAKVTASGGDLAGDELDACLAAAATTWQFPGAEAPYAVDVPITVMAGGSAK